MQMKGLGIEDWKATHQVQPAIRPWLLEVFPSSFPCAWDRG